MSDPVDVRTLPAEGECNYFPYSYLRGFLELVASNSELINVLTYDDLDFGDDADHEHAYPSEQARWREGLRNGRWDSDRIHLLIQHDVDRFPERTHQAVRDEIELGLRANVMVFHRRVDRQSLQQRGVVAERDYDLDVDLLARAEREHGFVIGYHTNAYERAAFSAARFPELFGEDLAALRQRFAIRFFSPHGGARDPQGWSNAWMELPEEFRGDVRWVHNRYTVRFDGNYSDGAINAVRRDPAGRDLREHVKTWERGRRYRVLIHPQYYCTPNVRSSMLERAEWYVTLCEAAGGDPSFDSWREVVTRAHAVEG